MRRFFDYYRQFEELTLEEITAELLERRDAERSRALAQVPALDLASPAWHEPPDAEAVNAATYALRRRSTPTRTGRRCARRSPSATASRRRRSRPGPARASC